MTYSNPRNLPEGEAEKDPLSPQERDEYERDLISFCDRELDLLGDIRGRNVLYAGGTSPLWIEGLAGKIGDHGSLAILDNDENGLANAEAYFAPDELPLRPRFACGDVFETPFERGAFDLVYSSGLLHELDVRGREDGVIEALDGMARVARPGGAVVGSDFVDDVDAAQIEDEAIEAEILRLTTGAELFGVGSSARIIEVLESRFPQCGHSIHEPFDIRHLDKLFFAEPDPRELDALAPNDAERLRRRRASLRERVRANGYTRPATLFFDMRP